MMRRREFLKLSLSAAGLLACPWIATPRLRGAEDASPGGLPVLELSGTPRERGRIHGEELRDDIADVMSKWKDIMGRSYGVDPGAYLEEFIGAQRFTGAMKKWTPGLLDEIAGMAEGAGVDNDTMLAYQFVDEEWWFGRNRRLGIRLDEKAEAVPASPAKCSVCAAFDREGAPPVMGQNLDLYGITEGHHVLLKIRSDDEPRETYVLTYAGLIGANGLNSRSVAICVNALLQLDHRLDGLPVAAVVRGVLAQPSFDAAVGFVKKVKHASGQAYTIGGPERIAVFECSANKVVRFEPEPGAKRLWHTNHPLANDDQAIYKEKVVPNMVNPPTGGPGVSEVRYQTFESRLGNPEKPVGLDEIKAALASHDIPGSPICTHLPRDGRLGLKSVCSVMELSVPPALHLSAGPPCSAPFKRYTF